MNFSSSSKKKNKKKTTLPLLSIDDYIQNSHESSSNSQKSTLASKILFQNTPNKKSALEIKLSNFNVKIWKITKYQSSKNISLPFQTN